MSSRTNLAAIPDYNLRTNEMFLRKIYAFFAVTCLSAFVICYVHLGHHLGLSYETDVRLHRNNVPLVDSKVFDVLETFDDKNISDRNDINELPKENNSITESNNDNEIAAEENDEDLDAETSSDTDTDTDTGSITQPSISEEFSELKLKLDVLIESNHDSNIAQHYITGIIAKSEKNFIELNDRVNQLIDEDITSIDQQLSQVSGDVKLIMTKLDSIINHLRTNDLKYEEMNAKIDLLQNYFEKGKKDKKKRE